MLLKKVHQEVDVLGKKVAVITGASRGIGLEMAKELAAREYKVIMACRDKEKAACLAGEMINNQRTLDVEVLTVNMASLQSIKAFCVKFTGMHNRLDVLLNNAGVFCDRLQRTEDGFEMTMGVNYLGPFFMTRLLLPALQNAPAARVINVVSKAAFHAKLKLNDQLFTADTHGFKAYAASKLAQILFTIDLAEELKGTGVTVNAAYPGRVATDIWKGSSLLMKVVAPVMMRNSISAAEGAKTGIFLAASPELEGVSGKLYYFEDILEYNQACLDEQLRKKLMMRSFDAVNLPQPASLTQP